MSWRAATADERQLAWVWAIAAASALILRPFWLALTPFLPPCPFRFLTGVPCPSCGTTHAAVALLHGHVLAALAANPLATVAGLGFVAGIVAPLWVAARGLVPELPHPMPRWMRLAIIAAIAANWAWLIGRS